MHRMLTTPVAKLTYRDYRALPDDRIRYEILNGVLRMNPSPAPLHQRVSAKLQFLLTAHIERHKLGELFNAPIDVLLGKHDIVVPDLVFVSRARAAIIGDKYLKGPPDLLVEILSPSSTVRDRRVKRDVYARAGVPFYWIVNPTGRTVLELELSAEQYEVAAEVSGNALWRPRLFPKLRMKLGMLWK